MGVPVESLPPSKRRCRRFHICTADRNQVGRRVVPSECIISQRVTFWTTERANQSKGLRIPKVSPGVAALVLRSSRFPSIPHTLDPEIFDDKVSNSQLCHPTPTQFCPPQDELPDRQLTDGQCAYRERSQSHRTDRRGTDGNGPFAPRRSRSARRCHTGLFRYLRWTLCVTAHRMLLLVLPTCIMTFYASGPSILTCKVLEQPSAQAHNLKIVAPTPDATRKNQDFCKHGTPGCTQCAVVDARPGSGG